MTGSRLYHCQKDDPGLDVPEPGLQPLMLRDPVSGQGFENIVK